MCLYGPLYEQPVGWSRTVPRDLLHRLPGTKHLEVVRKNSYFHAPILWIKQRSPNVNAENLTFIISMVRSMFGYRPTYSVTNKSGAYQVTHDIFSMIAVHSALLGPQAPQTKFEYVRDGIRTSNKDLNRKTLIPGISFPARYASRTSGMSSSLVLTDWKHIQT